MKKIDIFFAQKLANLLNKYILFRKKQLFDPDKQWEKLFVGNKEKFEFKINDETKINLYKDSKLSKLIYTEFEEKEKDFLLNFITQGDVFVDIGSNIGLHSMLVAPILKNGGHVYAFEPTPATYQRLAENVLLNNFSDVVSIFNLGLSDKSERLPFNVSISGYDAWNSFAKLKEVPLENTITVDAVRFDEFVVKEQLDYTKIALIKIDVEGWELNVLNGFGSLLNESDFNACFMIEFTEENAFRAGRSCRELYELMVDKNYEWFDFDPVNRCLCPAELKAYYPYENLIAIKKNNVEIAQKRLIVVDE